MRGRAVNTKQTLQWALGMASLLTLVLAMGPTPALAQAFGKQGLGAQVYEATEDARFLSIGLTGIPAKSSTSEFTGFVSPSLSPDLCPATFAMPIPQLGGQSACVLNLTGTDTVSLVTGLGPIHGAFAVVTLAGADSPLPATVVLTGKFHGDMDFSPVLLGMPYGTVTGKLQIDGDRGQVSFFGVFLLPFAYPPYGDLFLTYALLSPTAAGVQVTGMAPLQGYEYAIGYPANRFDIYFQ